MLSVWPGVPNLYAPAPMTTPTFAKLAFGSLGASAILALSAPIAAQQTTLSPPVTLTTQEDHQRMMALLGVSAIRQGANGTNPAAPNAANYDESTSNPYPYLPELLVTMNRERVTTPEMWWDVRRPEIVELFDREIYGRVPESMPAVSWEVVGTIDATLYGIPVIGKQLRGRVDNSHYPLIDVEILAIVATPANATGSVPVIISFSGVNFEGANGGLGAGGAAAPAPVGGAGPGGQGAVPPAGRGGGAGPGAGGGTGGGAPAWQEQLLEKGWGFALLAPNSVQADNGGGLTQGIVGLMNNGQPRALDDWGALRAWAWGASRLLDYFESDPHVDETRVGITGHSRYGKAAAVTQAYDERFAIGFISSSGAGGLSLYRRDNGELVENVAAPSEYHWMAGNFIKYASLFSWDDMPIDTHSLVALMAPRPVFISSGLNGDEWVDAKGMYLAGYHATPVYELLGATGLRRGEFPPVEVGLMQGDVSFRQHSGGHTQTPNWPTFVTFAERYFSP